MQASRAGLSLGISSPKSVLPRRPPLLWRRYSIKMPSCHIDAGAGKISIEEAWALAPTSDAMHDGKTMIKFLSKRGILAMISAPAMTSPRFVISLVALPIIARR